MLQRRRGGRSYFLYWYTTLLYRIELWRYMSPPIICKWWRKYSIWEKIGATVRSKPVLHDTAMSFMIEIEWVVALSQKSDWRVQSHSNMARKVLKGQVIHPGPWGIILATGFWEGMKDLYICMPPLHFTRMLFLKPGLYSSIHHWYYC